MDDYECIWDYFEKTNFLFPWRDGERNAYSKQHAKKPTMSMWIFMKWAENRLPVPNRHPSGYFAWHHVKGWVWPTLGESRVDRSQLENNGSYHHPSSPEPCWVWKETREKTPAKRFPYGTAGRLLMLLSLKKIINVFLLQVLKDDLHFLKMCIPSAMLLHYAGLFIRMKYFLKDKNLGDMTGWYYEHKNSLMGIFE